MAHSALSPQQWQRDVGALADGRLLDVLVVGGGVVGAGAALDAASRGLSVAVVEAQDWAAGTSSRSSKLVHGGLRYLKMLDFRLVREALVERARLLQLAPHLVRLTPFLYPLRRPSERALVGIGVSLYDLLARSPSAAAGVPRHRPLSRAEALDVAPALRADGLIGAVQYYDAQVDDARLVSTLVRTAVSYGAIAANRVAVTELRIGRGGTVEARLQLTDQDGSFDVRARSVVVASGPWGDQISPFARAGSRLQPSKGVHVVLERDCIASSSALIVPTDKSVLLAVPWNGHWLVGTTDTPWRLEVDRPVACRADVEYLVDWVNRVVDPPVERGHVVAVFAGIRPLAGHARADTAHVSREHVVDVPAPGFVVVSGGKLTTYRVMARDAIDAAVGSARLRAGPSRTAEIELVGAAGLDGARAALRGAAGSADVPGPELDRLLSRYGALASEVLELGERDPALRRRLDGRIAYTCAEVVYAATHEGARHVDDVLERRTRVALELPDRGSALADEVARLLAGPLGWSDARQRAEAEAYRAAARAEMAAAQAPDDASAEAIVRSAQVPPPR
ncbi:MAG TPA: glycerol-3-phosphate dehydrogenase/oxidase [Acidimicrobiales bacterium]|nr:glycerol-3-phosphate dehydrogenase/oxidase [Acidimicrobiales bacterium]